MTKRVKKFHSKERRAVYAPYKRIGVNRRARRLYKVGPARIKELTKHHRKPRRYKGTTDWPKNNIALVSRRAHDIWNTLFQNWPPNIIAAEATRYLPPGNIFIAIPLVARQRLPSEPEWHQRLRENRPIKPELWEELVAAKKRTPIEIAAIISRYFFDPEFELMVVSRS